MTESDRIAEIIHIVEDIEKSHISVSQYFKERTVPFGRAQYYLYKKAMQEKGLKGLMDQTVSPKSSKNTDRIL